MTVSLLKMPDITRAMRLRNAGMSYNGIAIAMREYHGLPVDGEAVRRQLRNFGAVPKPHGRPNLKNLKGCA